MNEHVATYYFDSNESGKHVYDVYACYNAAEDYDNREVSFYDVYDKSGVCVNEGDPFYDFPSWDDIFDNYYKSMV